MTEEFQRLWEVTGLAEALAARMALPGSSRSAEDPVDIVLAVHRNMLTAALREAREQGNIGSRPGPDELADALLGVYLSRRLAGRPIEGWV